MTQSIDLRAIVDIALDAFPQAPDGMDPAGDYAHRLLIKELARLRKEGREPDEEALHTLHDELDATLAEMLKVHRPPPKADAPQQRPRASLRPEPDLEHLVAEAFSAPYDGTPERRAVLAARARGNVEAALANGDWSWFRRIRLRRRAKRLIAQELAALQAVMHPTARSSGRE